jgi:fatty-acyl-CoA synthase
VNFELDWLKRWHLYDPDRVVLQMPATGLRVNYRDLFHLSNIIAKSLAERGIGKGDRVAILAKNHWFFVAMLFGVQRLGGILLPLNFRLAKPEIDFILKDAEPKLLLVENEFLDRVASSAQIEDWQSFIEFATRQRLNNVNEFSTDAEDPCLLLYTSGTTGHPKGALINHRMLFWNSVNTSLRLGLSENDVTVSFAPFFHTGGWNVLLTPYLHMGAKTLMLEKFDPEQVLELIEKEKLTRFFGVPTMLDLMARTPLFAKAALSTLRFVVVGGEPMPINLIRSWEEKGVRIRQGYGLTEFGPNVFSLSERDSVRKIGSIGFPNFYIQTRVVDSEGRDVKPGETGELWLKGPVGTPGYWRNEKATSNLYHDQWLKTGDLVRQDDDGYFFVAGRKKEMFISGGENVYPAEVEQALRAHPAVLEAAVIGIPDEKWGEAGQAFVVCKSSLTETEVLEHCRTRLARFKVPKRVVFLESLPKSDSGKILKRELNTSL